MLPNISLRMTEATCVLKLSLRPPACFVVKSRRFIGSMLNSGYITTASVTMFFGQISIFIDQRWFFQNCPMLIFDWWNIHFSCLLLLYNIFLPVNVDWLYPHFTYLSFHSNWSNVALCCLSPPCAWRMETDLHGTLHQWVDLRGQLQSTRATACCTGVDFFGFFPNA